MNPPSVSMLEQFFRMPKNQDYDANVAEYWIDQSPACQCCSRESTHDRNAIECVAWRMDNRTLCSAEHSFFPQFECHRLEIVEALLMKVKLKQPGGLVDNGDARKDKNILLLFLWDHLYCMIYLYFCIKSQIQIEIFQVRICRRFVGKFYIDLIQNVVVVMVWFPVLQNNFKKQL